MDRLKPCELCELRRTTHWYAEYDEPFPFAILDCDSCDVPMAVLGEHRSAPTPAEREVIQRALGLVADRKFPHGWYFDDHMRQIPNHYHIHVRPFPFGFPKEWMER